MQFPLLFVLALAIATLFLPGHIIITDVKIIIIPPPFCITKGEKKIHFGPLPPPLFYTHLCTYFLLKWKWLFWYYCIFLPLSSRKLLFFFVEACVRGVSTALYHTCTVSLPFVFIRKLTYVWVLTAMYSTVVNSRRKSNKIETRFFHKIKLRHVHVKMYFKQIFFLIFVLYLVNPLCYTVWLFFRVLASCQISHSVHLFIQKWVRERKRAQ